MLHTGPLSFCKWRYSQLVVVLVTYCFLSGIFLMSSSGGPHICCCCCSQSCCCTLQGNWKNSRHARSIVTSQLIRQMLRQMCFRLLIWGICSLQNESKNRLERAFPTYFFAHLGVSVTISRRGAPKNADKHRVMEGRPPSASGSSPLMSERCLQLSVHGS